MVKKICDLLAVSERRACRVLQQARATQRREVTVGGEEARLTQRIVELATCYGRYGYRRITALLKGESWRVNLELSGSLAHYRIAQRR
jgi:hypothetical protein